MSTPPFHKSSRSLGETLEARSLPVVGQGRVDLLARLAFWRNYALVLTVGMAIRIAIDLVRL